MGLSYAGLVVTLEGKLKVFGNNTKGQLGVGNLANVVTPIEINVESGAVGIKHVSGGYFHTLVLMNDGKAKSVGYNNRGQLALGSTVDQLTFQDINLLNIKQIACGDYYTMFLMEDGTVKGVGQNDGGQLGNGNRINQTTLQTASISGVKQIACGLAHTLFLMNDGTVKATGVNTSGELGLGDTSNVIGPIDTTLKDVKQIACGDAFSMFLMTDGTVKSVGLNNLGQLGSGSTTSPKVSPISLALTGVKQISCGKDHAVFLMQDGSVKGVGSSSFGQLATSTNQISPYTLPISGVEKVATGAFNTYFLMKDGSIKSCGYNATGQVGIGNTVTPQLNIVNTIVTSGASTMQEYMKMASTRFLFQQVDQLKTWLSGNWKNVAGPLTKELFLAEGVTSLAGIPPSMLTNGTKVLKWSDDPAASTLSTTIPKSLYDPTNKLYKGIGVVETAKETLTAKPKTLIVNADHTEALLSFSLDNGVSWYTIGNGEVKNINSLNGLELKVRATLPTTTATITALSYAWA